MVALQEMSVDQRYLIFLQMTKQTYCTSFFLLNLVPCELPRPFFFTRAEFIALLKLNLRGPFAEQVLAAFSALQLDAHTAEHRVEDRASLQGFL